MSNREIVEGGLNVLGLSEKEMNLLPNMKETVRSLKQFEDGKIEGDLPGVVESATERIDDHIANLQAQLEVAKKAKSGLLSYASRMEKEIDRTRREMASTELLGALNLPNNLRVVDNEMYGESIVIIRDEVKGTFCLVDSRTQKIIGGRWLKSKDTSKLKSEMADKIIAGKSSSINSYEMRSLMEQRLNLFPDLYEGEDGKKYVIVHNLVTIEGQIIEDPQILEFKDLKYLEKRKFHSVGAMWSDDAFIQTQDGRKFIYDDQQRRFLEVMPEKDFGEGCDAHVNLGTVVLSQKVGQQKYHSLHGYKGTRGLETLLPFYREIRFTADNTKRFVLCVSDDGKVGIGDSYRRDIVGGLQKVPKGLLDNRDLKLEDVIKDMKISSKARESILNELKSREEADANPGHTIIES